jgi:hypothetical protein
LTADEEVPKDLTCVETESDDYVWLGTRSDGLIRYDWQTGTKTAIDESDGLLSNSVVDLSVDADYGILWVATAEGLSKYDLGHTGTVVSSNKAMEVYPNPFSFSNPSHSEVVFKKLAPQSSLHIYDAGGTLVKKLDATSKNRFEWIFSWRPDRALMPGTYFCAARTNSTSAVHKLLILP